MADGTGESAEGAAGAATSGGDPGAGAGGAGAGAAGAGEAGAAAAAGGEAAGAAAGSPPQTVPIERFRAVIGQRAEREAQLLQARRELELANATIEEFKKLTERAAPEAAAAGTGGAAAPARSASPAGRAPTQAELEALVQQEAARQNFTRQCNEAFASGKAAHADFEKVIGDLNALSPVYDPRLGRSVVPQSLVEAALATGQAHEVLYALGKDSSLADRVLTMTPLQQAAELTKLSLKLEAAKGEQDAGAAQAAEAAASASKAPPPVKPKVTGSGSTAPVWDPAATDKFSTEEWIAKREADVRRAREATRH